MSCRGAKSNNAKGHKQELIERLATYYVPVVLMVSVLAGAGAMVAVIAVTYYGTIAAVRVGADPDTYGIPIVSSSVDLIGTLTLIVAIAVVGLG